MTKLVIVESPTKAKTISKFLGKDFKVESSFGHVRDLPLRNLGIDLEKNFEPKYIVPTKAKARVKTLKELAHKADEVILATDEDREGEAIAWHLVQVLGLNKKSSHSQRIVFHEITKGAIEDALKHPRAIYQNLVDAQQARRILDRIVGYKLSPFLWKKIAKGLSAGRVQSVAVRLIVERENEIRQFKSEEYWTIHASLLKNEDLIEATLFKINDEALEKLGIKNEEAAKKIIEDLGGASYRVAGIEKKLGNRNPLPPFTTSTMTQDASHRLGFSAKKTMMLAQKLYENGLITYMRTDSVNLSQESITAAKKWLVAELGEKYSEPRSFQTKSKSAQEAHEAIRPTNAFNVPDNMKLADDEKKLYQLIWQRFTASQMPQAKIATTTIEVGAEAKNTNYSFKASGQQIIFDGFLKVWPTAMEEKILPTLKEKGPLELKELKPTQHFTEPPPRYSEATLIKTLEEFGIGRPSTYAPIISVIQDREYVIKEKGRFAPTPMGELVNKVLMEHFPEIVDIDFTAKMEDSLDAVAEGKEQWQDLLGSFYQPFATNLENKYKEVGYQKVEKPPAEETGEMCDKCGKPMVVRHSRYGKFVACSGYPECKNIKKEPHPEPKSTGLKCPDCKEGEIVQRFTRRGRSKVFWGCSRYPDCKYATWENPVK